MLNQRLVACVTLVSIVVSTASVQPATHSRQQSTDWTLTPILDTRIPDIQYNTCLHHGHKLTASGLTTIALIFVPLC